MQNRVRSEAVILLERDDVAGEVVAADLVERLVILKELKESFEHAFIFAISIRFSEGLHFREVFSHGYMERRFFGFFAGGFESRDPKPAAFEFMALSSLCFESLRGGHAGGSAAALSAGAPFDQVQSFGKNVPIVVAFGVARNREQLPIAVGLDLLNDVDVGHGSTSC